MLINALCYKYEGTRPNSLVICAFGFFTHTKQKQLNKIKNRNKTMYTNKCKMHKMHEDMTFNVWRVLQRSKELDQRPKAQL